MRWIDIRAREEFDAGHVPGAEHAPLDQIERFAERLGPRDEVLLYCWRGQRTERAYHLLAERLKGRLWLLQGGYEAWLRDPLATRVRDIASSVVGGEPAPASRQD